MIDIQIDGPPIAWKRPGHRSIRSNNKNIAIIYDKQKKEKEKIRWQIKAQFKEEKFTVPLLIDMTFRMPIPKSTSKPLRAQMLTGMIYHMKKPDIDNLTKFILDVMNDLVFVDDAQISTLYVRKVYSSCPSTLIRIKPFTKNNYQDEIDQIHELEEDEYNLRSDGRAELPRDHIDKERVVEFARQVFDDISPV
jgi:Holliday junction resolvase RusA-like endonuclease